MTEDLKPYEINRLKNNYEGSMDPETRQAIWDKLRAHHETLKSKVAKDNLQDWFNLQIKAERKEEEARKREEELKEKLHNIAERMDENVQTTKEGFIGMAHGMSSIAQQISATRKRLWPSLPDIEPKRQAIGNKETLAIEDGSADSASSEPTVDRTVGDLDAHIDPYIKGDATADFQRVIDKYNLPFIGIEWRANGVFMFYDPKVKKP